MLLGDLYEITRAWDMIKWITISRSLNKVVSRQWRKQMVGSWQFILVAELTAISKHINDCAIIDTETIEQWFEWSLVIKYQLTRSDNWNRRKWKWESSLNSGKQVNRSTDVEWTEELLVCFLEQENTVFFYKLVLCRLWNTIKEEVLLIILKHIV
jgi:hypothetical protein